MAKKVARHKDVQEMVQEMDRAIASLKWLRSHVVTLHSLAYEKDSAGYEAQGRGPSKTEHYGDETGRLDCRNEWNRLRAWLGLGKDRRVHNGLHVLIAITSGIERVLNSERSGHLARPDGTIRKQPLSEAEFQEALKMQRKRGSLSRLVRQPGWTGKR